MEMTTSTQVTYRSKLQNPRSKLQNPRSEKQNQRHSSRRERNARNSFEEAVLKSLSKQLGLPYDETYDTVYECMKLKYTKEYIPDIVLPNGIIVELKGYFPPEDRAKMLQVKHSNPELDIRLVFLSNSKLNSKSKLRYTDWADKNGFICHVTNRKNPSIPNEWVSEVNISKL